MLSAPQMLASWSVQSNTSSIAGNKRVDQSAIECRNKEQLCSILPYKEGRTLIAKKEPVLQQKWQMQYVRNALNMNVIGVS